jgi:hypothetical protein
MTFDPLAEYVDAYRRETVHRERDSRVLRSRMIATAASRRRIPRMHRWLIPVAALLMGSVALAASGQSAERTWSRLVGWIEEKTERATKAPPVAPRSHPQRANPVAVREPVARADAPRTQPVAVIALDALPVAPPVHVASSDRRPRKGGGAHDVTAPGATSSAHRPEVPGVKQSGAEGESIGSELSVYAAAHALHFGANNPAGALAGWQRYLREYPAGALSSEARFNEAVCLIKLGRRQEARRLLVTLSQNAAAGPGQRQALTLLEGLQ